MAVFRKAVAGRLLLTLSLALLGRGAEGQGNGRGKKEVSGGSTVYLGQERDVWSPLMHTRINLSDINAIKSSFQFRTFDPEGTIFYGDTKNGVDWFVLALKDGIPLMQICKGGAQVSAAGGAKLNDGKWHKLELSSQGKFVVLEVDGSNGLVVGMQNQEPEEDLSGELRLALGGVLIDKDGMIVQYGPQMDACVRHGIWLNISLPWETEAEELWPCYENVRPGSYFPGTGMAIFNTSVFTFEADQEVSVELLGDFSMMDGTILSIKTSGPMFTLVANNKTKDVTAAIGEEKIDIVGTFDRLRIIFETNILRVQQDDSELKTTIISVIPVSHPGYLDTWRDGQLAVGGLLGEGEDEVGSQFLTGCLEKIRVQGRDLDLDLAVKHVSVTSHSCPA